MLYVGVDAHKATSQITVVNENGSILKRAKVLSTSTAFQEALRDYEEPLTAVLEASYCWGPSMIGWTTSPKKSSWHIPRKSEP